MARAMTKASSPTNKKTICINPAWMTAENAAVDIFINNSNCGIMMGKPMMAIKADCCCAFAAMAAKKVNTRLRLIPPKQAMPKNRKPNSIGLPNSKVKIARLMQLMTSIRILLKMSLASTKSFAPAME